MKTSPILAAGPANRPKMTSLEIQSGADERPMRIEAAMSKLNDGGMAKERPDWV